MLTRISILGSAAALLLYTGSLAPAQAAEPRALAPLSPWEASWGAEVCSLQRNFGSTENPSTLLIERFGASDEFALTIVDQELPSATGSEGVSLRFGALPAFRNVRAELMQGSSGRRALVIGATSLRGPPVVRGNDLVLPPVTIDDEAAATSLEVSFAGRDIRFQTGSLAKAFAALRDCTEDLEKSWGLDPAQQAALSRRVGPGHNPGPWVTDMDYPSAMLRARQEATVRFRLMIDGRGKPSSCHVQRTFGDHGFDEPTCAFLMRRASFKPALAANGQPVASYYINRIAWVIPR